MVIARFLIDCQKNYRYLFACFGFAHRYWLKPQTNQRKHSGFSLNQSDAKPKPTTVLCARVPPTLPFPVDFTTVFTKPPH